jgi:hypothetical protein
LPGAYPARRAIATPPYPEVRVNPWAALLGAIGGFVRPSAAGAFDAAPLQAPSDLADAEYQRRVQNYRWAVEQAAAHQADAEAARRESYEIAVHNALAQFQGNLPK